MSDEKQPHYDIGSITQLSAAIAVDEDGILSIKDIPANSPERYLTKIKGLENKVTELELKNKHLELQLKEAFLELGDAKDLRQTTLERMDRVMHGIDVQRERYAKTLELTNPQLLLLAGEMTARELRTVQAVLKNRAELIRDVTRT